MTRPNNRTQLALAVAALAASAFAAIPHANAATFISVNIAPPPLPVYEQPLIPGQGYLWAPGYWAWDGDINDYYWVPGTWVRPPYAGVLWTPGYWGWNEGIYLFHPGYWGPHIGYYGGINYGYGYGGVGYDGGYWNHGGFYYNTAVNHFGPSVTITNVYNRTVVNISTENRFSFNGPGGTVHTATRDELVAEHERHSAPVHEQLEHVEAARHDESLRASVNHGTPALAATSHAGAFEHGHEVAHPMVTYPVPHQNPVNHAPHSAQPTAMNQGPQGSNPNQGNPMHAPHGANTNHGMPMQAPHGPNPNQGMPMQAPHGPNPNQGMPMQAPHAPPPPKQAAPHPHESKAHDDKNH